MRHAIAASLLGLLLLLPAAADACTWPNTAEGTTAVSIGPWFALIYQADVAGCPLSWHVQHRPPTVPGQLKVFFYGVTGLDVPSFADWNGDGVPDVAVYRPSEVTWYVAILPADLSLGLIPLPPCHPGYCP